MAHGITYRVSFHSVVWCVYTGSADLSFRWFRHAKIGPPQNWSGWTDFGKKTCQEWSHGPLLLPKSVRPDQFWLPKLVPLANFGPLGGLILARSYLPKSFPPSLLFPILHYRAIPLGTCIGSYI